MSEINRYISFIKSQSVMELKEEELGEYKDFTESSEEIENYIRKMKKNTIPIELENSILENNMDIGWLGEYVGRIVINDLKEILNNKKILEYIKRANGRNI
jgi:hypothetical protein